MTHSVRIALIWAPRILSMLLAVFLSVFALDVFTERKSIPDLLVDLSLHLVPTFLILALLAVAWRRERVGAIAFGGLAIAYVVGTLARLHWTAYVAISGPMLLISILFYVSWRLRAGAPSTG
jgi:hypothetical protein